MKVKLIVAAACMVSMAASAQLTEGKVVYEVKINVHKSLPPEAEQMKAMLPEFRTSKMELAFKDQQSLYQPFKTDDEDMPSGEAVGGGGGGGGRRGFGGFGGGGNTVSFKDYEKDTKTEIRELGPKKYLIDDSLKHYTWKLATDTMTIMGHLCHKATTAMKGTSIGMQRFGGNRNGGNGDTTRKPIVIPDQPVTAWYADDIASPSGPEDFGGLPGLVLLVDIGEGNIVYTPLSFDQKGGTVKAPSGAKKITRDEYRELASQQFGGRPGGGGFGGPRQ